MAAGTDADVSFSSVVPSAEVPLPSSIQDVVPPPEGTEATLEGLSMAAANSLANRRLSQQSDASSIASEAEALRTLSEHHSRILHLGRLGSRLSRPGSISSQTPTAGPLGPRACGGIASFPATLFEERGMESSSQSPPPHRSGGAAWDNRRPRGLTMCLGSPGLIPSIRDYKNLNAGCLGSRGGTPLFHKDLATVGSLGMPRRPSRRVSMTGPPRTVPIRPRGRSNSASQHHHRNSSVVTLNSADLCSGSQDAVWSNMSLASNPISQDTSASAATALSTPHVTSHSFTHTWGTFGRQFLSRASSQASMSMLTSTRSQFSSYDPDRSSAASSSARPLRYCFRCLHVWRRRLLPCCRQLTKSRIFQVVMFIALLAALFLPDVWVVLNRPTNDDLDVILVCVLFLFLLELFTQSVVFSKTYVGSFFFWMDVIGAAFLTLDLSFMPFSLTGSSGSVSSNVPVTRAARMAKLGARAGRFTRLIRLLRFLPGMPKVEPDVPDVAHVVASRLIRAVSARVSCLIIVTVILLPLLTLWQYPVQDWSMESWLDILENVLLRNPAEMDAQLREFEAFYMEEDRNYFPYRLQLRTFAGLGELGGWPGEWESTIHTEPERQGDRMVVKSAHLEVSFNFRDPNWREAWMNILLLIFVMLLMVGFSMIVSESVVRIVLTPLERLLRNVKQMASKVFQSVSDMVHQEKEEGGELLSANSSVSNGDSEPLLSFGAETELLERVVSKLAALAAVMANKSADGMQDLDKLDQELLETFQGRSLDARKSQRTSALDTDADVAERLARQEQALESQRSMLEGSGLSLGLLDSWNFNPLELDKVRNRAACTFFLGAQSHAIPTDPMVKSLFLQVVEEGYNRTCPYHNWFHAVDVCHSTYRLLRLFESEQYLSDTDRFAMLVSAVTHDLGHPGLNNPFLVETSHELALRYNDKSPLENMHCTRLFEIVARPQHNIFCHLQDKEFKEVRRTCIEAILHTDNAHHFELVKEVQLASQVHSEILQPAHVAYVKVGDFPRNAAVECYRTPDMRKLISRTILHTADIANSTKPFRVAKVWAAQVLEEFYMQGDLEKRMGLPVQALNDRTKVNRCSSQIGFIEFLVAPLMLAVASVFPPLQKNVEVMVETVKGWQKLWISEAKVPPKEEEQKSMSDRVQKLEARVLEVYNLPLTG